MQGVYGMPTKGHLPITPSHCLVTMDTMVTVVLFGLFGWTFPNSKKKK